MVLRCRLQGTEKKASAVLICVWGPSMCLHAVRITPPSRDPPAGRCARAPGAGRVDLGVRLEIPPEEFWGPGLRSGSTFEGKVFHVHAGILIVPKPLTARRNAGPSTKEVNAHQRHRDLVGILDY